MAAAPLPSRYPSLWLQAIEEATECLRSTNGRRDSYHVAMNGTNGSGSHNSNDHGTARRTARGTEYIVPTVTMSSSSRSSPNAANVGGPLMQQYYGGAAAASRSPPCFFSHSPSSTFPKVLEASLEYLVLLESLLRQREDNWDKPPNRKPPRRLFSSSQQQQQQTQQQPYGSNNTPYFDHQHHHHHQQQQQQPEYVVTPPQSANRNRFAAFQTYNDDDETMSADTDEAGDEPLLNHFIPSGTTIPLSAHDMSMRRLLIRVLTNQSEIFAALANQLRQFTPPQWTAGAQKLTYSLACIHGALMLADSEISRWLEASLTNGGSTDWQVQKSGLFQDADIVEVSIESLTAGRELYFKEVKRVQAVLMAKLQPQWQKRDEVKAKMGARWYQNPAPKKDFARIRLDFEAQLRDVQEALQHLEMMCQTNDLHSSTERLRNRLNNNGNNNNTSSSMSWAETTSASSFSSAQQQQQRYNGQRPTDLSRRVDITDYPDPTLFGWTFTGSVESSAVEFFEKDNIKLDWYYTTGTVKTSMDHPTQGKKTQLFGAKVDAAAFRKILQNPRHHTGQRYHSNRGRGGGGGGGRGRGGGGGDQQQDQKQKRQRRRQR